MKFTELNLDTSLQTAINSTGFTECTPIQEQSFYPIVEGKDVAGLAQTGTGKTAAFLIPLMERILRARPQPPDLTVDQQDLVMKRAFADWRPLNLVLILVPTRELAEQVYENVQKLGAVAGFRAVSIYGGTGYEKQREGLKNGVEFVAATPGRLIDLYKDNQIDLKQVRAIVFDEADRMFDMGFKEDMKYILSRVPEKRQFLVFSATLNFDVLNTAYQFGSDPVEVNISRDATKAENVKDQIFHCGNDEKGQHLLSLIKRQNPRQTIIFTNFKHQVDRIARFLNDNGIQAMGISSLLSQGQRTKVIESFKADNDKNVLVATDVAARGLDIKGVDLVVNYDMPNDAESYVHRIGRTGRAGAVGTAFSLVSDRDVDSLMRVEDYLKNKREVGFIEDVDLIKDFKPMPSGDYSSGRSLNEATTPNRPSPRGPRRNDRGDRGDRGFDRKSKSGGSGGRKEHRSEGRHEGRPERKQDSSQHGQAQQGGGRGPKHRNTGGDHQARGEHKHSQQRPAGEWKAHPKKKHSEGAKAATHQHGKKTFRTAPAKHAHSSNKSIGSKVSGFFKKLFGG